MRKNTIKILMGLTLLLAACGNESESLAFGDSETSTAAAAETSTAAANETTTTVSPATPFVEIGGPLEYLGEDGEVVVEENGVRVLLNVAECPAETTTLDVDRGTNTIISLGIEEGECVFQHGASIDGSSQAGAVDQECRVPVDHEFQLASFAAGIGVIYTAIERDFCGQIQVFLIDSSAVVKVL